MFKKVIFRDYQELQAEDLNNIQNYASDALEAVIHDAITSNIYYTGFTVSQKSATEIEVSPGRLYKNGEIYISEQPQEISLFRYLPMNMKRVVTVALWGSQVETEVEPRDFLIDVEKGTTEPRAVAMQKVNLVNINLVASVEAIDPLPPALPVGAIPCAYVYLTTTGIEKIVKATEYELPNLEDVKKDVVELETWRKTIDPVVNALKQDLVSLEEQSRQKANLSLVLELASDMARLKEKVLLPSTYQSYDADDFSDNSKIDEDLSLYRLACGAVQFPDAARGTAQLQLFNPYDPNIVYWPDTGRVMPKYQNIRFFLVPGYNGDVAVSQYQWQTYRLRHYVVHQWQWVYGQHLLGLPRYYKKNVDPNWFPDGRPGLYVRIPRDLYRLETVTHTVNGALIAQTFLLPNSAWITGIGLYFTKMALDIPITVIICGTEHGMPNLERIFRRATITPKQAVLYPDEYFIPLEPRYLPPGRYAIVLITQGDYRVATAHGRRYTNGTFFYSTDGAYFQGDLTRDLKFALYKAQFIQPRTEVMFQPVSLAGGISDIEKNIKMFTPPGTKLTFEYQVNGRWYPIESELALLRNLPDLVPIRAVFLGSGDSQPVIWVGNASQLIVSRAANSLVLVSKMRQLGARRTNIEVQAVLFNYDPRYHTINCTLIGDSNTYSPQSSEEIVEKVWEIHPDLGNGKIVRKKWYFQISGGIEAYKVRLHGTRSASNVPSFCILERIDIAY